LIGEAQVASKSQAGVGLEAAAGGVEREREEEEEEEKSKKKRKLSERRLEALCSIVILRTLPYSTGVLM
jgi:hypothetical protein